MTTRDEVIAMAKIADPEFGNAADDMPEAICGIEAIERFSTLVATKERQRLAADVELPATLYYATVAIDGSIIQNPYHTADQLRDYGDRRAAAEREKHSVAWESDTAKMLEMAVKSFTAFLHDNCTGEPPRMEIAYANAIFQALLREKAKQ